MEIQIATIMSSCPISVYIFRSIYAPTPDLDPIIESMSRSREGERYCLFDTRKSIQMYTQFAQNQFYSLF